MVGEEGALTTHDSLNSKRRVLVVDDERAIRELVAEVVGLNGYETMTAEDGADALAKYKSSLLNNPFQIIVSDMIMPRMGGDKLCTNVNELADSNGLKRPYFIGMSGYEASAGYNERVEAYKNSVDFIQKPFRITSLRDALKRAEHYFAS